LAAVGPAPPGLHPADRQPRGQPPNRSLVKIPAVLFSQAATPAVAGLSTLERLVVAAHRAGCSPIHVVASGQLPGFRRMPALGIAVQSATKIPALEGPVFIASDEWLVTTRDVAKLLARRGRLLTNGQPRPVGVAEKLTGDIQADLRDAPAIEPEGLVAQVTDSASARAATRALWASLTSSADGLVDRYFNRPVGRLFSKVLIHTPVSPNQISIVATVLGVISAVLFGIGTSPTALLGALLLQLSAIVDCVDGDVARAVFKESPLGKWLDIVGDQVVHISVFLAIGIGLWRAGVDAPVLALAASAGVGVVISFAVVMRGLLNPELQKNTALQRLIDATTNRDFSVLLLILACVDRLAWFLWLAAFGVHVFWMVALSLQFRRRPPASA